jgi:K+-sensing histidine kinase KdpD
LEVIQQFAALPRRLIHNQFGLVTIVMSLTTIASYVLSLWFLNNIATLLILQLGVVTVALLTNKLPSILSGVMGALAYNYLFTKPYFSLHMAEYEDFINMLVFLIIAVITSHLAYYYKQQREQLKQAELRASILLSVSHDLRTPLASIIGTLETLHEYQDKLVQQQKNELLSTALEESHRLHRYIENLLQATKIQHGSVNLQFVKTDVVALINRVIKRFNSKRLSSTFAELLPKIAIQPHLLEQAIYNLIDNALTYSGPLLPVSITVKQFDNSVQIRVIDQGPGISLQDQSKVFELFYSSRQGDRGNGGTGLGLHVAAGIIQAHQGSLNVIPADRGCTMQIILPVDVEVK